MADPRSIAKLSEPELEAALRDLGTAIAWPATLGASALDGVRLDDAGLDVAARARLRIEREGRDRPRWPWSARAPRQRFGWSIALAVVALLAIAAIAGAIGFGLPGLRIVFGPTATSTPAATIGQLAPSVGPSPSVAPTSSPTAQALGASLGLGRQIGLADAASLAPFPIRVPTDARLGPPDTVWIDGVGRVTLVWAADPGLPSTSEPGIGLIVTALPGTIQPDYFQKVLPPGTRPETVTVNGITGYWISGAAHEFIYVDPSGEPVYDTRRMVGDTLAWAVGDVTYRVESGLGRDATIRLAETLR